MKLEATEAQLKALGFKHHDGYETMFPDSQADGAWPNGTTVIKVNAEDGDITKNGMPGIVMGSIGAEGLIMYFIEWQNNLRHVIGCVAGKLERADAPTSQA